MTKTRRAKFLRQDDELEISNHIPKHKYLGAWN